MNANTTNTGSGMVVNFTLFAVFSLSLCIFNVFGNTMTVIVICRREILRTIPNKYILNLAFADLMLACRVVLELCLYAGLSHSIFCLWASLLFNISSLMSIISLVLIAADRFVYIIRPLQYYTIITHTRTNVVIAASWVIAVVLCSGDVIWKLWFDNTPLCDFIFPFWFMILMFIICVLLNATLLVIYGLLLRIAIKQRKRISDIHNGSNTAMLKSDYKFLKVIFIVVGFTEACWIPFLTLFAINISGERRYTPTAMTYCGLAFYFNSALNFFVYAARDKTFYNAYKAFMCSDCWSKQ